MIWKMESNHLNLSPLAVLRSNDDDHVVSKKPKEITTLSWSPLGDRLVTGSYNGTAIIWSEDGRLLKTCVGHQGTILSLQWNPQGTHLLTGSADHRAKVWTADGVIVRTYSCHKDSVIDADWMDDVTFATCSPDSLIFVHRLGCPVPLTTFSGHTVDINSIRWNPDGRRLASCSDDKTVRIWSLENDDPLAVLEGHRTGIFSVRWRPIAPTLLATCSHDATVKIWDVDTTQCLHDLNAHKTSVYSIAFSPDGHLIASGSMDGCLYIWSVRDGRLMKRLTGCGCINEVCWNRTGEYVAGCCKDRSVIVVDMRS